jgi:hypothetical protein
MVPSNNPKEYKMYSEPRKKLSPSYKKRKIARNK